MGKTDKVPLMDTGNKSGLCASRLEPAVFRGLVDFAAYLGLDGLRSSRPINVLLLTATVSEYTFTQ